MAPRAAAAAASDDEDEVRLKFDDNDDVEEGVRGAAATAGVNGVGGGGGGGGGGRDEADEGSDSEHPPVAPLRLPDNGEIDVAASRMLQNISKNAGATKLGRMTTEDRGGGAGGGGATSGGDGGGTLGRRNGNPESVEVPPGPTGFTIDDEEVSRDVEVVNGGSSSDGEVNQYADPVADAMMAKIFKSASTTQLGRSNSGGWGGTGGQIDTTSQQFETQDYTPGYEDTLSPKDRKLLESEMRKLRETRMVELYKLNAV
jgi:hypothetical protein